MLVTLRPDDDSQLVFLLQERAAQVNHLPLIRIGPPPDERELQAAIDGVHLHAWLAFTSAVGVAAFARRLHSPLPPAMRIAAIGPATARSVELQLGRRADLVPPYYNGGALADALVARLVPGESVLIVAAKDARPALTAKLRAAGARFQSVVAYTTVPQRPPQLEQMVAQSDAIVLGSPSAVHALVNALGKNHAATKLRGRLIACIGPVTLFEARHLGLHVEVVPELATAAALVDSLCTYYSEAKH